MILSMLKKIANRLRESVNYLIFRCFHIHSKGANNSVSLGARLIVQKTRVNIIGRNNHIIIGNNVELNNVNISLTGDNLLLEISNGVMFAEGGRIRIEDKDNQLRIGENTCLINVFFSLADEETFINVGKDCLFSAGVVIRSSDSHSIINQDNRRINMGKPISIGDHVWIGNGATILKGVRIGGGQHHWNRNRHYKGRSRKQHSCR